jgi:ABC-type multidrug transport system fused ATPase/permease subunit
MAISFIVVDYNPTHREDTSPCTLYLRTDTWDDFNYRTTFRAYFSQYDCNVIELGRIKIAYKGMSEVTGNELVMTMLPDGVFSYLDEKYFSIGETVEYYDALNKLTDLDRVEILTSLRDVAYDLSIFRDVKKEPVTQASFLRDHKEYSISAQLHRRSRGGVRLTNYAFKFTHKNGLDNLSFKYEVLANSTPPSNVHALIGRNGVGKTTILGELKYE